MSETINFKPGQDVTVVRRNGETSPAKFVAPGTIGDRGVFHTVKLADGKEIKARPSQIAAAA